MGSWTEIRPIIESFDILQNQETRLQCSECGLRLASTQNWARHEKICTGPAEDREFFCRNVNCGDSFETEEHRKQHEKDCWRDHPCTPGCGKTCVPDLVVTSIDRLVRREEDLEKMAVVARAGGRQVVSLIWNAVDVAEVDLEDNALLGFTTSVNHEKSRLVEQLAIARGDSVALPVVWPKFWFTEKAVNPVTLAAG